MLYVSSSISSHSSSYASLGIGGTLDAAFLQYSMSSGVHSSTVFLSVLLSSMGYVSKSSLYTSLRYLLPASTFAGESGFGSLCSAITLRRMVSIFCAGDQVIPCSSALSPCTIQIHTFPSEYILRCHISEVYVILGGAYGYSGGKATFALYTPPSYRVSGGPLTITSHSVILFSFTAILQFSEGFSIRCLYSAITNLETMVI
uniref:PI215L n=1 Tax=African swine fever virus TaxID=10497 RepID=A0A649YJL7_ASF